MHVVVVGGSDAGISAGLRARELSPSTKVSVSLADAYPNFSVCGLPFYVRPPTGASSPTATSTSSRPLAWTYF
jgi:NADPH-dependent 2,4-dienoyl-CoA reductase/sulfur reductase-like enzyme